VETTGFSKFSPLTSTFQLKAYQSPFTRYHSPFLRPSKSFAKKCNILQHFAPFCLCFAMFCIKNAKFCNILQRSRPELVEGLATFPPKIRGFGEKLKHFVFLFSLKKLNNKNLDLLLNPL